MDSFDDWAKASTQHPCMQQWADRLAELGASWDSFSRESSEIVSDLVTSDIPVLAARDIVDVASAAVKRRTAPMAVFWDLENMPIPADHSGRAVTSRLKSILAPHGDLVQFRGYASIGLGLIPQQKRSDLQLSGCHLVDCPHNGRKEVADKMIIVDAMQFAFMNPEGATLCFITGDVDYAYLLAVLQRPQWRTIVISKGTMQSVLHVNCDMKMRWETDILRLRHTPSCLPPVSTVDDATATSLTLTDPKGKLNAKNLDVIDFERSADTAEETDSVPPNFEPLTADEEWQDDAELLRTILNQQEKHVDGIPHAMLKSLLGCVLRETNPARFHCREDIRTFFARVIEKGVALEHGQGATKLLSLPSGHSAHVGPPIRLSEQIPIAAEEMPARVVKMSRVMPFVLFVPWSRCPQNNIFPKGTFVHPYRHWAILMFHTLTNAQRAASTLPWLRAGTLVNWGRLEVISDQAECCLCMTVQSLHVMKSGIFMDELYCSFECLDWATMTSSDKEKAVICVVSLMEMMSNNDDVVVPKNLLRNQLVVRYPLQCNSRKLGSLWINEAIKTERLNAFEDNKNKLYLAENCSIAMAPFPPDNTDTTKEENHLVARIEAHGGCMRRTETIKYLADTFKTMQTPFNRTQVLLNAYGKGKLFVNKGACGQVVALTANQGKSGIFRLFPNSDSHEIRTMSPLLSVPKGTPSHNDDQDSEVASSDDEVLDLECIVTRKGDS